MKDFFLKEFLFRIAKPSDHLRIINVQKEWWGERDLTFLLPRLFLNHFYNTSLIVEKNNQLIAFLIGFLSPAKTTEGYIHFVGVHPNYQGKNIGRELYHHFFSLCIEAHRYTVRSCTSPVNRASIEFHRKLGFRIISGNGKSEGVDVTLNYNMPNDPKVLFEIFL
ncbi:MAG: GNAT family N-acetyltransferase [Bacteroidetes bacterium]|nr:GNAT family N-acetyltransferase [Bacteroidota bacterium]